MCRTSINRLKIVIVVLFGLPAAFFLFDKQLEEKVSGQSLVNLAAPTDVTATDGIYSTKIGLRWDTIRGATDYRVFRSANSDPAAAIDVGFTRENSFFDITAPQGQTFFYWIRSENANGTSILSQAEQGFRASGTLGNGTQPLSPPDAPAGNPITATKASLGKVLFWDEQLSSTRTVACGTCHSGASGGVDKRTNTQRLRSTNPGFDGIYNDADDVFGSPGVMANNANGTFNWSPAYGFREQVTSRRAMPYTDAAYSNLLFWDGRATTTFRDPLTNAVVLQNGAALESQVLGPPVNDAEMAHSGRNWQDVAMRVSQSKPLALAGNVPTGLQNWIDGRTYPELFEEAFGTPEVTPARIAMAIATHERTLFSDQTPFDQFNQGIGTLTTSEANGRNLFNSGVTGCTACHTGSLLTDDGFHYIGVRPSNEDTGRQQVTGNSNNSAEFRTPNLHNVELRGAYFHNGNFTTLRQVVDFYARGGDFDAPNKDVNVRPRNLSNQQRNDIVAFLSRPMTDPRVRDQLPPFDHPLLYTESNRVPQISGTGRAGAGGIVPQVYAIEPPLAGNPSFAVGIANARSDAQAVLVIDSSDPGVGNSIPAGGSFTRRVVSLSGSGYGSVSLPIPNNMQIIGQTFFGRWYVTDASAENGFSVSQVFQFTVFGEANSANSSTFADFDGDHTADISVFRPDNGTWYRLNSGSNNSFSAIQFGISTDKTIPADYDGDGKTDLAVFRNGTWYLQRSSLGFTGIGFGLADDVPVPADFDGDGKTDLAVFRPSSGTWYVLGSQTGFYGASFGQSGDRPLPADYDGDGKADLAVFRNGTWYIQRSQLGFTGFGFGLVSDLATPADYDGDGKTDVAVFRPSTGTWYLQRSTAGFAGIAFGQSGDLPTPADYDGDGKTDVAVFRPSNGSWYLNRSTAGFTGISFGLTGDKPIPNAYVR